MVPDSFKRDIASTFYDKEIFILSKEDSVDAEGGRKRGIGDPVTSFKGNVNYKNLKEIQEEYGLDYEIDLAVTTDYAEVKIDDVIRYLDVVYVVTESRPFDSHYTIVAVKYGNQSRD